MTPNTKPSSGNGTSEPDAPRSAETLQTGVQALVSVVVDQIRADRARGLHTGCFVSGYPGSPLGEFDMVLERRLSQIDEPRIVHRRGGNEELAATAVMGSQLASTYEESIYDGVLGVWYGKAPGLDRSADALRHAVFAGTSPAGAVAFVGDDPENKSSTLPSASEGLLAELGIPVFAPGTVQEVRDLGAHAIACSRQTGLWTAVKIVSAIADGSGLSEPSTVTADSPLGEGSASRSLGAPTPTDRERVLHEQLRVAAEYGVTHDLNRVVSEGTDAKIGMIVAGNSWAATMDALRRLGVEPDTFESLPIRMIRMSMLFPLDRSHLATLCEGLDEVLVVEEKRPFLEEAFRSALYGRQGAPAILGKEDRDAQPLLPRSGALDGSRLIGPLREWLEPHLGEGVLAQVPEKRRELIPLVDDPRTPFFCSGCPHSVSLQAPDGAKVGVGIGCHGMAYNLPSSRTGELVGFTQMGGEGAQWVGTAPFVGVDHIFQNLGDGTFAHSGILAIRFAIASGVNITYKILYNSAVAMTGGQDAVGALEVPDLCRELLAEGAARIVVTTEDLSRYRGVRLPDGVTVESRDRIVDVQSELARIPGVTVLIHDQACAAELRRARKRGLVATPRTRVLIDERLCENCGDCGVKSACLSLQPVETPFGTKTMIDQSSCNLDMSCVRGDCPSFITVEVTDDPTPLQIPTPPEVPDAVVPTVEDVWAVRMPGIGGTGVVTAGHTLARAGALCGLEVSSEDQTGLSQKAGPVLSEIHLSLPGTEAAVEGIDALLVMDPLTAAVDRSLDGCDPTRTGAVGTSSLMRTGISITDPSRERPDAQRLLERIESAVAADSAQWRDADAICNALFGSTVAANTFVLGMAYQAGLLPVSADAMERALREGPAAEINVAAFAWGRAAIAHPELVAERTRPSDDSPVGVPGHLRRRIEALGLDPEGTRAVERRAGDLVDFQRLRTAEEYLDLVDEIRAAERGVDPTSTALTETVAEQLYRVTAYKDEYEVARLLMLPESKARAESVGGAGTAITWNLHPPMLRSMGRDKKMGFGPRTEPVMRMLRSAKFLRGTPLDVFGYAKVRRHERSLLREYRILCHWIAEELPRIGLVHAVHLAGLVAMVRGYEEVKERNLRAYQEALFESLSGTDDRGATIVSIPTVRRNGSQPETTTSHRNEVNDVDA